MTYTHIWVFLGEHASPPISLIGLRMGICEVYTLIIYSICTLVVGIFWGILWVSGPVSIFRVSGIYPPSILDWSLILGICWAYTLSISSIWDIVAGIFWVYYGYIWLSDTGIYTSTLVWPGIFGYTLGIFGVYLGYIGVWGGYIPYPRFGYLTCTIYAGYNTR